MSGICGKIRDVAKLPHPMGLEAHVLPMGADSRLFASACATFLTMFALGAARSLVTSEQWWRSGLETLALGALVAMTAYGAGVLVARLAGAL